MTTIKKERVIRVKKTALVLFLFLIVIMIGGEVPTEFNKSYYRIENNVMNEMEFIENSVKIQYVSELTLEEEKDKILDKYKEDYEIKVIDENTIFLEGDVSIKFHIWLENEKVFLEGTIENNNSKFNSKILEKQFERLIDEKTGDVKVFNYCKGKIKNSNLDELKIEIKEKFGDNQNNFIDIENGFTGKVKFEDGTRLNYSVMEYNTGIYLIIGTPIIFKAY